MDKEPLLPYNSPRRSKPSPPPLLSLPEEKEISIPLPEENEISILLSATPSELKERLIFGPASPKDTATIIDAITLIVKSHKPTTTQDPTKSTHQERLIDPNVSGSKSRVHRSGSAPVLAVTRDSVSHPSQTENPQSTSPKIIRNACVFLILYFSFGVVYYCIYRENYSASETNPVVDALYFCIVSFCTIGYGDITPRSASAKVFSIIFVLVGFTFVESLLTGMVGYMLDLQESYLIRICKKQAGSYVVDLKKGRMRIRIKVVFAGVVVSLCIGIGLCVMHFVENLGWLDSLYLSVMSVTTVGYGDQAFKTLHGRIFASIWLLVSTLAVARAFIFLVELKVQKRHKKIAKLVLSQDMTVSEFLAADIDNNGCVGKSEFVIHKLKELGKVSENDITMICQKFERIDTDNRGKITLDDLVTNHPSSSH